MPAVLTELKNPLLPRLGSREVTDVSFDIWTLRVRLSFPNSNDVVVAFEGPEGFRVLDEGDLDDFWGVLPSGAVLEVRSGGWFDLEASRSEAFSARKVTRIKEYFVPGVNFCVSVIASEPPTVSVLRRT